MGREKVWIHMVALAALLVTTHGGCNLPSSWSGRWFETVNSSPISINQTHIGSRECTETDNLNRFLVYDRAEACSRCLVIHKKHPNVLQFKESMCLSPISLKQCEDSIQGDDALQSMFRLDAIPDTCPFKQPPFTMTYSRGDSECKNPPSRADACTDDTRLVFRYQACADVPGSEAVEEALECLAAWRESSVNYLVARIHVKGQQRFKDDESLRCFVYQKIDKGYEIGQSGEPTCSGMMSAKEGSKVMKLTRVESKHSRCRFPPWVTHHYHWHSLDFRHNYHFSHRNASLKVSSSSGEIETKLFCHSVSHNTSTVAKLVVHAISGCEGGYKCMVIYKRDSNVIQAFQSSRLSSDPSDACSSMYDPTTAEQVTLIRASLPTTQCPLEGRYSPLARVQDDAQDCTQLTHLQSVSVGCNDGKDTMDFYSSCKTVPKTAYSCHGSWRDNTTSFVIGSPVSRHSTDARYYCFIFNEAGPGIVLQRVAETCTISARQAEWSFNITETGKCYETSFAQGQKFLLVPSLIFFALLMSGVNTVRFR